MSKETVNRRELALRVQESLAEHSGIKLSKKEINTVVDAVFHEVSEVLKEGSSVCIRNFGTFRNFSPKVLRTYVCIATKKRITTPAHTTVRFKASPYLRWSDEA